MVNTPPKVNRKLQRHGAAVGKLIVQIYEIQSPWEAEAVVALGVDHVGSVVLSAEDWRLPLLRETVAAVQAAGAKSSLIPLFSETDLVLRTIDYYRPDLIHFCEALPAVDGSGPEWDRLIAAQIRVKEHFPEVAIMRSIPIAPRGLAGRVPTLEYGRKLEPATDFFLTDTLLVEAGAPNAAALQPVSGFVGITGTPCDWDAARALVQAASIPVVLAGGISPNNVREGVAHTRPAGVDSCTLTNAADGPGRPVRFRKDLEKVRRLVAAVRLAERATG
jgi:phosphoribosylanthranilate isomerase